MFRRFVIFLNIVSFTFIQTAMAANVMTNERIASNNEFLKESGLTKHDVTFEEMQQKFGKNLPEPIRQQMEALIKENPNLVIPKMDVQKVKVNGQDQLQFNINTSEGSLIVTTSGVEGNAYTVVGKLNGKEIKFDISYDTLLLGHQVIYESRRQLLKEKSPAIYSAETFEKLSRSEKQDYIKQLRGLLEAAEATQNSTHKPASVGNYLFSAFENEAMALTDDDGDFGNTGGGGGCIVAGWTNGVWAGGKCSVPAQARQGNCGSGSLTCNPALYGNGSCVPFQSADDKAHATRNCGTTDSGDKDFSKVIDKYAQSITKLTKKDELEKFLGGIRDAVGAAYGHCRLNGDAKKSADQHETCLALRARVASFNDLNCEKIPVLKSDARFADACKAAVAPPPAPPPGIVPPLPAPGADSQPVPPALGDTTAICKEFEGHPTDTSHCGEHGISTVQCQGKDVKYCTSDCEKPFVPEMGSGQHIVKCYANGARDADKPGHDHGKKEKDDDSVLSKAGDWFSRNSRLLGVLGILGVVGYGMYSSYQTQQAYLKQQQQIWAAYNSTAATSYVYPTVVTGALSGIYAPPAASRVKTFAIPGTAQ